MLLRRLAVDDSARPCPDNGEASLAVLRDGRTAKCLFLGDAERWKLEWANRTRAHSWVFIFPNRMRNRMLHRFKFMLLPRIQNHPLYRMMKSAGRRVGLHLHE